MILFFKLIISIILIFSYTFMLIVSSLFILGLLSYNLILAFTLLLFVTLPGICILKNLFKTINKTLKSC
jgi:hypothetical protein